MPLHSSVPAGRVRRGALALVLFLASAAPLANGGKVLTLDDYGRWNRIVSTAISPDGRWVTYGYRQNGGDDTLHVKNVASGTVHTIANGAEPKFADDSAWVAYVVNLPKKEAEKLRKAKKPVTKAIELLNLASGEKYKVENASTFTFPAGAKVVAIKRDKAAPDAKHEGVDLIVRTLATGATQNIGNVADYQFNKAGTRLAFTVDAADDAGNGVSVLDLERQTLTILSTDTAEYARPTWNEAGDRLAILRGTKPKDKLRRQNAVLLLRADGSNKAADLEGHTGASVLPGRDLVISELGEVSWSKDGSRVFIGFKEQEPEPEKSEEPVPNVDVWHWKDERVQSVQIVRADADRRATIRASLDAASGRLILLTDDEMPSIVLTEDGRWGIGRRDKPYRMQVTWGGSPADYYRVDTATGERSLIVKNVQRTLGASPDSKWYVYQKDKEVWAYNLESGTTTNVSKAAGISFIDEDDDHPYEKPTHGMAGFTKDGAIILNHRFDLWKLPLGGGTPKNLTGGTGAKQELELRYVDLDPDERAIDLSKPILLSAYGEWTKQSGYYRLEPGGALEKLVLVDKSIGRPAKAKSADRILYTTETFVEFPDYYVSATDFKNPIKVTHANPHQSEYAWGRRVLVDYKNSKGVRLQGTLTLPAGYQPGKRYPMLVYFYEKMSNTHHRYSMPVYDDRPHMSTYASNGYLVFQPDVVYTIGRPGDSAVDCVTSGVKKVIDLGYADPDHIGLQGHSWGGYQSSFIVTQTDMFAAVVTGAPVTNLVSFYGELYKSTGTVQQGIVEIGQVRMGAGYFDNPALYHSQSPVHQAQKIKTPFMILHGTEDGAVDWHQGLEFYNAAKRLGKEVILVSYPGEAHHLGKEENQKDFQVRMKQFFDHYLKEVPAPSWMTDGVPQSKKARPAGGS
jgi:dipeptidyl aminopeptidase/acylaminoacyl peptidase